MDPAAVPIAARELHNQLEAAWRLKHRLESYPTDDPKKPTAADIAKVAEHIEQLKVAYAALDPEVRAMASTPQKQPFGNQAANTDESDANASDDEDDQNFSVKMSGQAWVLYNVAHEHFAPKSDEPAVRIGGLFATKEECRQTALQLTQVDRRCHWLTIPAHEPFLVTNTVERVTDPNYVLPHLAQLAENELKRVQHRNEDFQATLAPNKTDRSIGKTKLTKTAKPSDQLKTDKSAHALSAAPTSLLPGFQESGGAAAATSRGDALPFPRQFVDSRQRYAVVSFILDKDDDFLSQEAGVQRVAPDTKEFSFTVYAAFDTERAARRYLRTCLSKIHPTRQFFVVEMYQWLDPFEADAHRDDITERYENPELNQIMKQRRAQKKDVQAFEDYARQRGMEPVQTIIARDGTAVATDMDGAPIPLQRIVTETGVVVHETPAATATVVTAEPVSLLETAKGYC